MKRIIDGFSIKFKMLLTHKPFHTLFVSQRNHMTIQNTLRDLSNPPGRNLEQKVHFRVFGNFMKPEVQFQPAYNHQILSQPAICRLNHSGNLDAYDNNLELDKNQSRSLLSQKIMLSSITTDLPLSNRSSFEPTTQHVFMQDTVGRFLPDSYFQVSNNISTCHGRNNISIQVQNYSCGTPATFDKAHPARQARQSVASFTPTETYASRLSAGLHPASTTPAPTPRHAPAARPRTSAAAAMSWSADQPRGRRCARPTVVPYPPGPDPARTAGRTYIFEAGPTGRSRAGPT